ncbi:error-prone DNA polymerase [Nocardioides sp. zg-1228]|uniref:error-prone DNA polymerase n=1 Tax=Nocardioides sp. zg-1228 TaxID=2763008 RepID=UPI0016430C23|nr:error-prone DNA polymerase [Nocardioides sp. zg-1228]MBC2934264.1 error-prone DNA polymerase [Nocardioides sp. zg-1228]QSF59044.1 error-prone DNA polymerase [Nocardioides sp. zg-1228]
MGWNNPAMRWKELERRLSGLPGADDAPVSRRKRATPEARAIERPATVTPYAELHCHSHFSFLDGASSPAELVEEAVRLGLSALAITDHDGFYGAPMLAEAAAAYDLPTVFGAELSLGLSGPQNGVPDPEGSHLLVLARGVEGYHRLAAAMTDAHLRGDEKGRPVYDLDELGERGRGHWVVLTGCRKGTVRQALAAGGEPAAAAALDRLTSLFGLDDVLVELSPRPGSDATNAALAGLAAVHGLDVVAAGNVHHATPQRHRLASAMAAVRARRSLAELDGWLDLSGSAHLRSGAETAAALASHPGAVERSVSLAEELAFDLRKASPALPKRQIPEGHTADSWLRVLAERGFAERYAGVPHEREARERLEHELRVIAEKDFAGYFVIVHDIVAFARERRILCQGRGSAASSAVCYALGITAVDAVFYKLPFERFISAHRDEEPDIDVDFDSDRREEVIQWVYDTYGRRNAAQVANVIAYRPRMAVRDAAKALGFSPGQQDAWSKQIDGWSSVVSGDLGDPAAHDVPPAVVALADELMGAPRHLGIHSGGMVLTERPIGEVCPIERARMDRRTVLQWDKDACESMGLVKFDLLGLGMLGALDHMMRLVGEHLGEHWDLATMPKEEPAVYDMLCRADSIGVFQVESRAQIGTLPRLRPREFYDLAIEIALIRPGPIQGGAVHPYVRRATGQEPVTYDHPELVPVLERTKGVPLFQEQLMAMAVTLGDCSRDDADLLRRAMGSKRGVERIESVKAKLYAGMRRRGITGELADSIYVKILSFANFGFAESHALSFALLVYASSWFKLHYPAAFLAGLLRNQPMGFYSPQSLVHDARRHDVDVRRPDVTRSAAQADLEPLEPLEPTESTGARPVAATGLDACRRPRFERVEWVPGTPDPVPAHRRDGALAVRLGLDSVRGIGLDVARRIVAAREEAPFTDITDLSRRAGLTSAQLEALATAGAFEAWGLDRRSALWAAGFAEGAEHLPGTTPAPAAPTLPGMSEPEITLADLWATGVSPERHPVEHLRAQLRRAGVRSIAELATAEAGRRVHVGGLITHRQRPGTAMGVTFLNLEDETGMLNVVCSIGVMKAHRQAARNSVAVVVRGRLERNEGVTNLVADRVEGIDVVVPGAGAVLQARASSRDFR